MTAYEKLFSKFELNVARSEEHTSELQSQSNLVCRLLLEKKKNKVQSNADYGSAATTDHSVCPEAASWCQCATGTCCAAMNAREASQYRARSAGVSTPLDV